MKRDEVLVDSYLRSLNLGRVIYEPDGKVPPDFLVGERIAVECRRLNKHYLLNGRPRGLEEDSIPLLHSIEKLLSEFGPPNGKGSWFILIRVKRPFSSWKQLRKKLESALRHFLANPDMLHMELPIEPGFTVRVAPASPRQVWTFAIGAFTDFDRGGWVVSDVVSNLLVYVDEKSQKVAHYRSRYAIWWLIFVDHIGYARDGVDVRMHFSRPPEWDKLVLLSPVDGTACEI